jgi:hypothetical protein
MVVVVWLAFLGESRLEVYVSLFTVSYFAASALFRPRRRTYDVVGASLFLVFCCVVALKVMDILF